MIFFMIVYSFTPNILSYNTVFFSPDEDCEVAEQSSKLKRKPTHFLPSSQASQQEGTGSVIMPLLTDFVTTTPIHNEIDSQYFKLIYLIIPGIVTQWSRFMSRNC